MFVGDQVLLDVGFDAAAARLASLIRGESLVRASREAYAEAATALLASGHAG